MAAGDYIADSDDEEFKEALKKIELNGGTDGENQNESDDDSEVCMETKDLAAALDIDDEDEEGGEDGATGAKAEDAEADAGTEQKQIFKTEKEIKKPKKTREKIMKEKPDKNAAKPAAKNAADTSVKNGASTQ